MRQTEHDEKRVGPRGGTTTTSPGGLIRKAFWMHPDEVAALRKAAYEENRTEAEIIREIVREHFNIED